MKKKVSKLELSKETVRNLAELDLEAAVAAATATCRVASCYVVCRESANC